MTIAMILGTPGLGCDRESRSKLPHSKIGNAHRYDCAGLGRSSAAPLLVKFLWRSGVMRGRTRWERAYYGAPVGRNLDGNYYFHACARGAIAAGYQSCRPDYGRVFFAKGHF